jgi:hypothetical protein
MIDQWARDEISRYGSLTNGERKTLIMLSERFNVYG